MGPDERRIEKKTSARKNAELLRTDSGGQEVIQEAYTEGAVLRAKVFDDLPGWKTRGCYRALLARHSSAVISQISVGNCPQT